MYSILNLENDKNLVTVMFANAEFYANHLDAYFEIA